MTKTSLMIRAVGFLLMVATGVALGQQEQNTEAQEGNQQSPSVSVENYFQIQNNIYNRARRYGDNDMAKAAIYNILALSPNNVPLYDSLALIYFEEGKYAPAVLVSNDVIEANSEDQFAVEISALGYENLGLKGKALDRYESLYLLNDNIYTQYKITFLQYELERFKESMASVDLLLENPEVKDITVYHQKSDRTNQQVSMEASLLNLKGLIKKSQGENEAAKSLFETALEKAPTFELAQNNLQSLK